MNRLLVALIAISGPLAGCVGGDRASDDGQCPAGEVCSPETPDGLQFIGSSLVGSFVVGGPLATAIGGTQEVELDLEPALGVYTPFDLTFTVDDQGGAGVRFDHQNGNIVTVRGAGSFSNYLRILDPSTNELFDRKELTGAQSTRSRSSPTTLERSRRACRSRLRPATSSSASRCLARSRVRSGRRNHGSSTRRWSPRSMARPGTRGTRWSCRTRAAGTFTLSVTAGNLQAMQLPLDVVDGADLIVELDPTPDDRARLTTCALPRLTRAAYVAGLAWTFEVDGVATAGTANCVTSATSRRAR